MFAANRILFGRFQIQDPIAMTTVIGLVAALLLTIVVLVLFLTYCYKTGTGCFSKAGGGGKASSNTRATSFYSYPGTHAHAGVVREIFIEQENILLFFLFL